MLKKESKNHAKLDGSTIGGSAIVMYHPTRKCLKWPKNGLKMKAQLEVEVKTKMGLTARLRGLLVCNPFSLRDIRRKIITTPSLTIPDEAISVSDLLASHLQGMSLTGNKQEPSYNEDAEGIDLRRLDYTEIDDLSRETQDMIKKHEHQQKKEEGEKQKKQNDALIEKRVQDEILKREQESAAKKP